MREVTVGAVQPAYLDASAPYHVFKPGYLADAQAILEHYVKPQIEVTAALLIKAGEADCDIVTTSEDMAGLGNYLYDTTETNVFPALVDGSVPLVEERLSAIARQYNMYVVGCYFKRLGGTIYNVAALFDRAGSIVGHYRKVQLPAVEAWQCAPGDTFDVFDTDFGKVGLTICYDMMFPEPTRLLVLNGAELVMHPTLGYGWYDDIGEATLRTRANDSHVHIVTAKNYHFNGAGKSSIIDHWGQVLHEAGFYPNAVVTGKIDLDAPKMHPDWYAPTHMSGMANVRTRMLQERLPATYAALARDVHGKLQLPGKEEQRKVLEGFRDGSARW